MDNMLKMINKHVFVLTNMSKKVKRKETENKSLKKLIELFICLLLN